MLPAVHREEGALGTIKTDALADANMDVEEYHVEVLYSDVGWAQAIARSDLFQNGTLALIISNAVYIGVDADNNKADSLLDADWGFQFCEHFFACMFVSELLIRFISFRRKCDCLRDLWFRFDSSLVACMVLETWVTPSLGVDMPTGPLRLLRLLRLSRLAHMLRFMPEMAMMLKGMLKASRAVGASLLMVTMLVYVFGVILYPFMKEAGVPSLELWFSTLGWTMWTLFLHGTLMLEPHEIVTPLIEEPSISNAASVAVFFIFMMLTAITILNLLIGVLCEVVTSVAQNERDQADIHLVKGTILLELKKIDADGNGSIGRDELDELLSSEASLAVLQSLHINARCLEEVQDMLFSMSDQEEVPIKTILNLFMVYRGSVPTTVKHLIELMSFSRVCLSKRIDEAEDTFERISDDLSRVSSQLTSQSPHRGVLHAAPCCMEGDESPCSVAAMEENPGTWNRQTSPASEIQRAATRWSVVDPIQPLVRDQPSRGALGQLKADTLETVVMDEVEYHVESLYHDTGIAQALARSEYFQNGTLCVIIANAVYIGVDVDTNDALSLNDAALPYQVCEHFFCAVFVTELLIRFCAFQTKGKCLYDSWFRFDAALVVLMVLETWVTPNLGVNMPTGPLRLFRLLRLTRLGRLLAFFPEMTMILRGMVKGARAVGSSLLMIVCLIYVFGIILFPLVNEAGVTSLELWFSSLGWTMWTLFLHGTLMLETHEVLTPLVERWTLVSLASAMLFLLFLLLSAITIMNLLTGIFCELVTSAAEMERDEADVHMVKTSILSELKKIDTDGNGTISSDEFEELCKNPIALQVFHNLHIGTRVLDEIRAMLYDINSQEEVPVRSILDLLMAYRGNTPTTVRHLVDIVSFARVRLSQQIDEMASPLAAAVERLERAACTHAPATRSEAAEESFESSAPVPDDRAGAMPVSPICVDASNVGPAFGFSDLKAVDLAASRLECSSAFGGMDSSTSLRVDKKLRL